MRIFVLALILVSSASFGQTQISNKSYLKKFLKSNDEKSLLIVGENHGSGASAKLYPTLVKYLNKKTGLNTLLIEFGPAEAYFYTRYLETGDVKHLNYTLYAGAIKDWRDAWKDLYEYNKKLKKPLRVIGIDFDRTRTLAYALYSIFTKYEERPDFLEGLLSEIRSDSFYTSYTIGYPNQKDIRWANQTKELLRKHLSALKQFLNEKDMNTVQMILDNKAVNYAEGREDALAKNAQRIIEGSDARDFLLLIGRNHAYLDPLYEDKNKFAKRVIDSSGIRVLTGILLYENAEFSLANQTKIITLFEVRDKSPWKRYYSIINKKARKSFTVVPLLKELCPLSRYTDYILVARDQQPYQLLHPAGKK